MEMFLRYGTICVLSIISSTLCYLRVDYWGWFLFLTFGATMRILDLPLPQSKSTAVCTDSDDLRSEARVRYLAFQVFGNHESVDKWMVRPNPEFSGKTPIDLIKEGKTSIVMDFLTSK